MSKDVDRERFMELLNAIEVSVNKGYTDDYEILVDDLWKWIKDYAKKPHKGKVFDLR